MRVYIHIYLDLFLAYKYPLGYNRMSCVKASRDELLEAFKMFELDRDGEVRKLIYLNDL